MQGHVTVEKNLAFQGSKPIREWERFRGLSHSSTYRSLKRGDAPKTYKIGRLRFVSAEADAEWLRQREQAA